LADYEVRWTETTVKALEELDRGDSERVIENIGIISGNPFRYVKRLKGVPIYSLRISKCRVILSTERKQLLILIMDVGKRKNVYEDL
jgi:mRNA interferase RelE/StbE